MTKINGADYSPTFRSPFVTVMNNEQDISTFLAWRLSNHDEIKEAMSPLTEDKLDNLEEEDARTIWLWVAKHLVVDVNGASQEAEVDTKVSLFFADAPNDPMTYRVIPVDVPLYEELGIEPGSHQMTERVGEAA